MAVRERSREPTGRERREPRREWRLHRRELGYRKRLHMSQSILSVGFERNISSDHPSNLVLSVNRSCSLLFESPPSFLFHPTAFLKLPTQLPRFHSPTSHPFPSSTNSNLVPRQLPLTNVLHATRTPFSSAHATSKATIVAKTVTTILRNVKVLHPHPSPLVLSSNLSSRIGQMRGFEIGDRRLAAGTQEAELGHQPQGYFLEETFRQGRQEL
jgi:hypothetical protein